MNWWSLFSDGASICELVLVGLLETYFWMVSAELSRCLT